MAFSCWILKVEICCFFYTLICQKMANYKVKLIQNHTFWHILDQFFLIGCIDYSNWTLCNIFKCWKLKSKSHIFHKKSCIVRHCEARPFYKWKTNRQIILGNKTAKSVTVTSLAISEKLIRQKSLNSFSEILVPFIPLPPSLRR